MSVNSDWITAAVAKARLKVTTAPDGVWPQVEALLRGSFSERPIPAMQLEKVARQLIEAMVPPPAKVEKHP